MADDLDELGLRLDRVEHALRRSPDGPSRTPAGPEIRSARSIVNRVDDVWVAVTEGNDRVAAAIDDLRVELGRLADAVRANAEPPQDEGDRSGPNEPGAGKPGAAELGGQLQRIEESLARLGEPADPDPAVHLRLNRVEEALAGIAGRLDELVIAARPAEGTAAPARRAAVEELGGEVRGLAQRVDALVKALEASAARSADGTLAERLGRLRDQFRR